ncbi:hypothetical protein MKY27_14005 [Solibacillus sp. FSL R5-0449]|uniref:hypothetical protein n=1 Tax=Solibacillus sp. FSL R5-0449 TaxID=2921639 RepID=UPI0030CD4FA2
MKMTKAFKMLGAFLIISLCLFTNTNFASANTYKESIGFVEEDTLSQQSTYTTRYVEVNSTFWGQPPVPYSVEYNKGGYSGTLTYISHEADSRNPKKLYIKYGGYVRCEGVCMAPSSLQENE